MAPTLAESTDDLTHEWFTAALRAGGVLDADAEVCRADAVLFGTGQFGLVARATLDYRGFAPDAPASVIVKLPSQDPGSRGLGVAIGAYEAEVRFYQELVPRSTIAVPRAYWTGVEPGTGRVTLVLEDLSADWQVGDALAGGTVAQAEAALDQISRLHADLWDDPGLRELDWLAPISRTQMLFDGVPAALPVFRERFAERLDPAHMKLVEHLAPKGADFPTRAWRGPMVVAHGDYRLDNVLFRDTEAGLTAKIIDWQSLRLAPPMIDAGIWLASCLTPADRRTHQDALLRRYHDRLVEGGVRDFGYADCVANLRVCSLYTFLAGIGVSVTLARSDRGDAMFAGLVAQSAELVRDLDADTVLD